MFVLNFNVVAFSELPNPSYIYFLHVRTVKLSHSKISHCPKCYARTTLYYKEWCGPFGSVVTLKTLACDPGEPLSYLVLRHGVVEFAPGDLQCWHESSEWRGQLRQHIPRWN